MMSPELYQAFQQCLALSRSGVPLEECLARHPAHARELRPLLLAAASPPDQHAGVMPADARRRVRQRVMDHWERTRAPRRNWSLARFLPVRWAAAAAAVLVLTLGGGVGTVAAAQDATPGASLYTVKRLQEDARLWFTRSPEEKVALYSDYARERVREILRVHQIGSSTAAQVSLSRLEEHLTSVDHLMGEVPSGTPLVQTGRSEIINTLENSLDSEGAAGDAPGSVALAPGDAYPCLQHTLKIIRKAREQVRSALDNVGGTLPPGTAPPTATVDSFCPQP